MADPLRTLLDKAFLEHPRQNGESYGQHILFTWKSGIQLLIAAICLLIHGLIPGLFTRTASTKVKELNALFEERQNKSPD